MKKTYDIVELKNLMKTSYLKLNRMLRNLGITHYFNRIYTEKNLEQLQEIHFRTTEPRSKELFYEEDYKYYVLFNIKNTKDGWFDVEYQKTYDSGIIKLKMSLEDIKQKLKNK